MLDKKQIWVIFLSEFKMGLETTKTTHNINNTFDPGAAKENTVQWWFRKVCKRDESLQDAKHSGQSLEAEYDPLRGSLKLILSQLHEKLLKNSTSTILCSFGIWSKLERWKSSISGCLMSSLKIKKNCRFEMSSSLTLCNREQRILWDCDVPQKWILYKNWWWLASSVVELRRSSKALPKAKLHQKKVMVIVRWFAAIQSTTAFWIPEKALYLRSMFSKSIRYTEKFNVCSNHWLTERVQFFIKKNWWS